MSKILSMMTIILICLIGCQSDDSETPAQAIQAIIQLYEASDFDTLVRTRYAEISKIENEEQMQSLINRFETTFQNQGTLDQAISTYLSVLNLKPKLSEKGTVATFRSDSGAIVLSRMPNGRWGFHL